MAENIPPLQNENIDNRPYFWDWLRKIRTRLLNAALVTEDITAQGSVLLNTSGKVLGYTSGAGDSVTQITSKSTSVTINKAAGRIVMHNASLASGAQVAFLVNNSVYTNEDIVMLMITSGATPSDYNIWPARNSSGVFAVYVKNIGAGSLAEAIEINFILVRGATE